MSVGEYSKVVCSNEGQALETSALKLLTVANLRYQLRYQVTKLGNEHTF